MSQSGGPAAINGFLYQILNHLGWLANLKLSGTLSGQNVQDACLVLEPRHGGDARHESSDFILVEQYKTRQNDTWSMKTIIEDVLPDLRKAVPEPYDPAKKAKFRFVTDGRKGRLEKFDRFLRHVQDMSGPETLDDTDNQDFGIDFPRSYRKLFNCIVEQTRRPTEQTRTNEQETVFQLLKHFEMDFEKQANQSINDVNRMLRCYAPDLGEEQGIRERLVGILIDRLSQGETHLDNTGCDALLNEAGCNPERMRNLAKLFETLTGIVIKSLPGKYQIGSDVRGVPEWLDDKPVLLIAGDSGQGKTWQLCRLIAHFADNHKLVVFETPNKNDSEDNILNRASNTVWQTGLGETNEKTLQALVHHYQAIAPNAAMPWLTIAVDDVQDSDLARALIRQDWNALGMRLVMTVSAQVADSVREDGRDTVIHTVGRFTVDELDKLLGHRGERWVDLPGDLQELLRAPILAGMYLDLDRGSFLSAPDSEYEIFNRFWRRITHDRGQANFPGDEGIIIEFARYVLDNSEYPLPRPKWREIGLDDASLLRLKTVGWLICNEGQPAFAHDRLLNWAAAKNLVLRFKQGRLLPEALANILKVCHSPFKEHFPRPLYYVPMDMLWLLASDQNNATIIEKIIEIIESEYSGYGEILYRDLLPTLGQQIIPALLLRLDALLKQNEDDYRIRLIGKCFAKIACQERVDLLQQTEMLLNAPSRGRQSVGLAILFAVPHARFLDRLWVIHQERYACLCNSEHRQRFDYYDDSFKTVSRCIHQNPEWLRQRILSADKDKEPVSELTFLLKNLDHSLAPHIWQETKEELKNKVNSEKFRGFLHCIRRFADYSMIDFVIDCLAFDSDHTAPTALTTLVSLDPDKAIELIANMDEMVLSMTRNWWLPLMMHVRPHQTCQKILDLAQVTSQKHRLIADLFSEHANNLDEPMLHFFLRTLETDLRERLSQANAGNQNWLFYPLQLLKRITRPELLNILAMEAGGELEKMIVQFAVYRIPYLNRHHDHLIEDIHRFLLLIGGEGLTELINQELTSQHLWARHRGLIWAVVRSNAQTIECLSTIASWPISFDVNGQPNPEARQEFTQASFALAALQQDDALVQAIWTGGATYITVYAPWLRGNKRPMSKALTERAMHILNASKSPTEDDLVQAITVALVSADSDFIQPVREILSRADPNSRVANLSCSALQQLGDQSAEFVQLAIQLMNTEKNNRVGVQALLALGNIGIEPLKTYLESFISPTTQRTGDSWQVEMYIINALWRHSPTRDLAVQAAIRACNYHLGFERPFHIAAESSDPDIREKILTTAFDLNNSSTSSMLNAIKGLAKFAPERALEAAENALKKRPDISQEICKIIAHRFPEKAIDALIDASIAIGWNKEMEKQDKVLRSAIGRALRRLDEETVSMRLTERMEDSRRHARAIATELAGWLSPDLLNDKLSEMVNDTEDVVQRAALEAIDRKKCEILVKSLMEEFQKASEHQRWILLHAIVNSADPYLLNDKEDILWIDHILNGAPIVFAHKAQDWIKKRKEKL
ncbi:MAG: HEAT repeat domain-containing protein [Magnetococcales bacterium]|nr:HEAT repeat domain-containing protein [Magnetococcales bacterium]